MSKHRKGKVNLAYITDDSSRRVTFKKRNQGLLKKLNEITTLCDVKACAVVYNPEEAKPILYPNDPVHVLDIAFKFMELSETEQKTKMYDQEGYLKERIAKTKERVSRLQMDNRERKLNQMMYEFLADKNKTFDSLSVADLKELNKLTDRHLREIDIHIHTLQESMAAHSLPPPPPPPPQHHPNPMEPNQILAGSEEIPVIDPPMVGLMGALPSPCVAGEDNDVQGHGFADDFNNNNNNNNNNEINMQTNFSVLDQWFMELTTNSQAPAGGSSSNVGPM